jgi:hypothetical protein
MRAEEYSERRLELEGWDIRLSAYRLDGVWYSKVENVSPGAALARAKGATRDDAESKALEHARELLSHARRQPLQR